LWVRILKAIEPVLSVTVVSDFFFNPFDYFMVLNASSQASQCPSQKSSFTKNPQRIKKGQIKDPRETFHNRNPEGVFLCFCLFFIAAEIKKSRRKLTRKNKSP
jgi:hypothetical protein